MAIEETLEWRIELGKDEPKKQGIVLGAAFGVAALGLLLPYSGYLYSMIGFGLVLASNAELFLPQVYRVSTTGVQRKCGLSDSQMTWEQIKRVVPDEWGVKCSPFTKMTRTEPFRGVYLRFANNRDAVLAKIHEHFNGDPKLLGGRIDHGTGGEPVPEDRPRNHEAQIGGSRDPDA
jgi:hypothetical protein